MFEKIAKIIEGVVGDGREAQRVRAEAARGGRGVSRRPPQRAVDSRRLFCVQQLPRARATQPLSRWPDQPIEKGHRGVRTAHFFSRAC